MKRKYDINYISFWDELTFSSIKQLEIFIDLLLKEDLQIYWTATSRADLFKKENPPELLQAQVIKVARLDGPDWRSAKGLVDRALEAESQGVTGRA